MTSPDRLIEAAGVTKAFGEARVLRGVSLSVARGEAVAIVGSNGAGKSTLLKCLVGLQPIDQGSVRIFGEAFTRTPTLPQRRRLRRQIGFVFQFHGLVGRLSALSNVVHGGISQGSGFRAWHQAIAPDWLRRDAMAALDRVGLAARAHDRAEGLSGGQSQRVAIARAIVHRPALIIADEPAASLDPSAGTDAMALFRELAGGDVSLIFTTHNIDHALTYSDRIIAMRHGEIVIDAASSDVTHADVQEIYGA